MSPNLFSIAIKLSASVCVSIVGYCSIIVSRSQERLTPHDLRENARCEAKLFLYQSYGLILDTPPSITSSEPVTKEASSDARYSAP